MWLEFCLKQFHQVRLSIKLSMIWFASNYSFFINRRELKISPKISISFEHAKCSWKLNQWYCGNFDAIHSFFLLEQQIEKKIRIVPLKNFQFRVSIHIFVMMTSCEIFVFASIDFLFFWFLSIDEKFSARLLSSEKLFFKSQADILNGRRKQWKRKNVKSRSERWTEP